MFSSSPPTCQARRKIDSGDSFEPKLLIDLNGAWDWFMTAKPGDRLVYHTGLLAFDRERQHSALDRAQSSELNLVADFFFAKERAGEVVLGQRRLCPEVCSYSVQRAHKPQRGPRFATMLADFAGREAV